MSELRKRFPPDKLDVLQKYWIEAESECDRLRTSVAELETKIAIAEANLEIARANAASNDLAQETLRFRIAELVALHIEVVHCGGQLSAELLAKIERATQEEAGWTEFVGSAHGPEPTCDHGVPLTGACLKCAEWDNNESEVMPIEAVDGGQRG